ncbi:MAG: hypothetical protein NVS4B9_39200 [Ktedonobacteraceae bacterium]
MWQGVEIVVWLFARVATASADELQMWALDTLGCLIIWSVAWLIARYLYKRSY